MREDQRTFERRNLRVPISCWETVNGNRVGPGTNLICHDMSSGGLSFETSTLHAIHSVLYAEVHLPGRTAPLTTHLQVVRVENLLGRPGYLIGTSFVDIKQAEQQFISSCLEKLDLYSMIRETLRLGASDLHLTVGRPPVVRRKGRLHALQADPIEEGHIRAMIFPLLSDSQIERFERERELDFAFSPGVDSRFRINLHYQRGFIEAVMRSVPSDPRSFEQLGLPQRQMEHFCSQNAGLILVAGTTGSGKTTTMSSMVDHMNRHREVVVITIEDPIEFTHTSHRSIIKQRELGSDTNSYAEALRRTLRQDPDVIVVGELSDPESVLSALRAAETGHLVISTVHAPDTEQAVERLVNLFPPEHASTLCRQIASCLVGILYQTLVPGRRGDQVLATELMVCNHAIRNLVREKRFNQISNCIQTGRNLGMYTLQSCLDELNREGMVDPSVLQKQPSST